MSDYCFGDKRNKRKDKKREKKKHPYKSGGKFRGSSVNETENKSEKVVNVKFKKSKKKRKGQVTLFIILAIVLVVGVVGYFVFLQSSQEDVSSFEHSSLSTFVVDCVEKVGEEVVLKVSRGGGYYIGSDYSLDIGVPVYFDESGEFVPSKSDIEREISFFVSERLFFCTRNFVDFPDLEVDQGVIEVGTEIRDEEVVLNVKYPINVRKGDEVSFLKNFGDFSFKYRLGEVYDLADRFVQEQRAFSGVCLNCVLGDLLKGDFYLTMNDYNNYTVFLFKDEKEGQELIYSFAGKFVNE